MAQWSGLGSGNIHQSKVYDCEQQLRHAIEVFQNSQTLVEGEIQAKKVIRFAERLLSARVRPAKARVAALKPLDNKGRKAGTARINQLLEDGISCILDEFHASDVSRLNP